METVSIDNFSQKLISELGKYTKEIADKVDAGVDATAKIALADLKANSPKRTGESKSKDRKRGQYAKGWRLKVQYEGRGNKRISIHNATDWQLTHLLEYGHASKRGGRYPKNGNSKYSSRANSGSRVAAQPHVQAAQEKATTNLQKLIKKAVQEG